jgi:excisionase family DNA binding protein
VSTLAQHLSPEQVASRTSLSVDTIYRLCRDNRLPSRRIGRRRIISETDVVEFLEQDSTLAPVIELRRAK